MRSGSSKCLTIDDGWDIAADCTDKRYSSPRQSDTQLCSERGFRNSIVSNRLLVHVVCILCYWLYYQLCE